ncbi:MAG: MarR family transcriptional regulator [Lyngbya sp. HA4199-MV5]|nr:MarR family transcriptional regulator [Lyngbya sp. HA4199-MV5]
MSAVVPPNLDPTLMKQSPEPEQQQFVETVGISFELVGLPRMAGRILGWLLISNPPHQSPGELADVLQASKGSISTMTRLLTQIGLIERTSLPGHRRDYFRIKPNAWAELTKQRILQIKTFRELAEQGLALTHSHSPQLRQRLEEMHAVHAFLEQELPLMMERWEQQARHLQMAIDEPSQVR